MEPSQHWFCFDLFFSLQRPSFHLQSLLFTSGSLFMWPHPIAIMAINNLHDWLILPQFLIKTFNLYIYVYIFPCQTEILISPLINVQLLPYCRFQVSYITIISRLRFHLQWTHNSIYVPVTQIYAWNYLFIIFIIYYINDTTGSVIFELSIHKVFLVVDQSVSHKRFHQKCFFYSLLELLKKGW